MKYSLIPFLWAITLALFAAEINISTSSQSLVLTGDDCSILKSQQEAICNWKNILDPSFVIPKPSETCQKISNKKFSITVSQCLPGFVKANQNKKLMQDGANCWGTAMSFKQLSIRPRFLWSNEIVYWLESPLCRKLNVGEKKQPGDILNVYGPEYVFKNNETPTKGTLFWDALFPGRLVNASREGYSGFHNFLHSETYLSDQLSFGKDSPNRLDKFEFNLMKEVYGRSRDKDCQENQSITPHMREYQNQPKPIKGSKCDYFTQLYRCENVPNYFAKQALSTEEKILLNEIQQLSIQQDKLFPLLTGAKLDSKKIREFLQLADRMASDSLHELSKGRLNKNREMLLTLKYFTASGIRKSLELADLTAPTEAL